MPQEQGQLYCQNCGRWVLGARQKCNHMAHALVSLFLCGLWLPVWVIADEMAKAGAFRCQVCGWQGPREGFKFSDFAVWLMFLIAVLIMLVTVTIAIKTFFS